MLGPSLRRAIVAVPICVSLLPPAGCGRPASREAGPSLQAPPPGLEFLPPAPGSYELPVIQTAADGDVLDTTGGAHRLFDYIGGRFALLSFVYTHCSDGRGCPFATATMRQVREQLAEDPALAGQVRLITLSFDPERDTPDRLRGYAGTGGDDGSWVFLTTASNRELQPILDGYGQYIVPEADEQGRFTGSFKHVLKVFLIDRQRRVRNIYSTSFLHPVLVTNDIRTLLMAEAKAS
ncbi:MAG: SCO family protein [Thermoanaerobaculia bacterium]